jgi:hypothetical protein
MIGTLQPRRQIQEKKIRWNQSESHTSKPLAMQTSTLARSMLAQRRVSLFSRSYNSFSRALPVNTVIKFVPQQEAWIMERMGKFEKVLTPGLQLMIPVLDSIKYVQSLKETTVEIPAQSGIPFITYKKLLRWIMSRLSSMEFFTTKLLTL